MSWFSDIANKAEKLLTTLDQGAAEALQNGKSIDTSKLIDHALNAISSTVGGSADEQGYEIDTNQSKAQVLDSNSIDVLKNQVINDFEQEAESSTRENSLVSNIKQSESQNHILNQKDSLFDLNNDELITNEIKGNNSISDGAGLKNNNVIESNSSSTSDFIINDGASTSQQHEREQKTMRTGHYVKPLLDLDGTDDYEQDSNNDNNNDLDGNRNLLNSNTNSMKPLSLLNKSSINESSTTTSKHSRRNKSWSNFGNNKFASLDHSRSLFRPTSITPDKSNPSESHHSQTSLAPQISQQIIKPLSNLNGPVESSPPPSQFLVTSRPSSVHANIPALALPTFNAQSSSNFLSNGSTNSSLNPVSNSTQSSVTRISMPPPVPRQNHQTNSRSVATTLIPASTRNKDISQFPNISTNNNSYSKRLNNNFTVAIDLPPPVNRSLSSTSSSRTSSRPYFRNSQTVVHDDLTQYLRDAKIKFDTLMIRFNYLFPRPYMTYMIVFYLVLMHLLVIYVLFYRSAPTEDFVSNSVSPSGEWPLKEKNRVNPDHLGL